MTALRFNYQQDKAQKNISTFGKHVLNLGCNTDPAHLKELFPNHVLNVDFMYYDYVLDKTINADMYFDITKDWPLCNNNYGLVILGDIMEHIRWEEWPHVLAEARRVASNLCITVPNDSRIILDDRNLPLGSYHVIQVTEEKLKEQIEKSGWEITEFVKLGKENEESWWIEYYFLLAERN